MLLNNQRIIEEIKEEITKCLEINDNENTTIQNLWDEAKAALRGKFIAIQSFFFFFNTVLSQEEIRTQTCRGRTI